jgi:hypothetical protein
MLAALLPGLRELRAPLAAGYLWLLAVWLAFADAFPSRDAATGALAHVYELNDGARAIGLGVALSFLAYLVGALSEALLGVADRWLDRPFTSSRTRRSIELVVDERLREFVAELGFDRLQDLLQEQLRGEFVLEGGDRNRQFGQLIRALEERIVRELDLVATRLIGNQAELYSTIDRLRAEAELRLAIAPPLVALSVFLAITEHVGWASATLAVAILVWQGVRRRTKANDVIADALLLGPVEAPILERLRRAAALPSRTVGAPEEEEARRLEVAPAQPT